MTKICPNKPTLISFPAFITFDLIDLIESCPELNRDKYIASVLLRAAKEEKGGKVFDYSGAAVDLIHEIKILEGQKVEILNFKKVNFSLPPEAVDFLKRLGDYADVILRYHIEQGFKEFRVFQDY